MSTATSPAVPPAKLESIPWTSLVLVALTVVLFLVAAVPGTMSLEDAEIERARTEARLAIDELRAAIEEYRIDHGMLPGHAPREGASLEPGDASEVWFERQLTMNSDLDGKTVPQDLPTHPFGPYLWEIPQNPLNGLADVRVLSEGATLPSIADGTSGWIFDPRSGEIRLNASGELDEGTRAYDI